MYYVYILKGDKKHYVGYTADLQTRRGEHLKGWTKTTSGMGKISLCGYFEKETKTQALKLERIIKKNGHIQQRLNHQTFITMDEDMLGKMPKVAQW